MGTTSSKQEIPSPGTNPTGTNPAGSIPSPETEDQYLSRYEASLDDTKKQMIASLSKEDKLNMARSEAFKGGRRRRKK